MFGFGSAIRDLSEAAHRGELQVCKGRDEECAMAAQALSWMYRKSVLVVGGSGAGKTTFLHGVAAAAANIADGGAPQTYKLVWLNPAVLKSRTVRIKEATIELLNSMHENPRQILVIDGIFPILGAKSDTNDPAFLLGAAVKKSDICCIGTMATKEFEEFLQGEPRAEHIFKVVRLRPFSRDETLALLTGMRPDLERESRLRISDKALQKSISLSQEYLPDIELPGKAIMTLRRATESCSRRLRSPRDEDCVEIDTSLRPLGDEVGTHDVKCALAGLASANVFAAEARKWETKLAERLKRRIFGQDIAVEQTVAVLARIRARSVQAGCPAGVVVFGGPCGAGKAHMARNIAKTLMGNSQEVVDLSLPEYTGKDALGRLFGAVTSQKAAADGKAASSTLQFVLLREMENADPLVLGPLLRITTHDCIRQKGCNRDRLRKCLFIFTLNCDPSALGGGAGTSWLSQMLASRIRKDLVDRIDAIVPFIPLDFAAQSAVMRVAMAGLYARASERRIRIGMSEEAFRIVAREGYTRELGAKGVLRILQQQVIAPVVEILDSGELSEGGTIDILGRAGLVSIRKRAYRESDMAER